MLSRLYRFTKIAWERIRITRFRASEAASQHRILGEILTRRLAAAFSFLILAGITLSMDLIFSSRIEQLGWPEFLRSRFHLPGATPLTTVASALAVAVATVTGLLFSISLVVLQNAGQRYGARFVRYLIGEPVTRYLQDLLFLTFLFSLWTLAVLVGFDHIPFFTLGIAATLGIISILSLPVYREHTLSFLIPDRAISGLGHDLRSQIRRIPKRDRPASRSVTGYLRHRASERVDDLRSFIRPLLGPETQDDEGAIHLAGVSLILLSDYSVRKADIAESSGWFATTWTPVSPTERFSFVEQRRMFDQLGLGRPARETYDLDWLERELFHLLAELVRRSLSVNSTAVAAAVLSHLEVHIPEMIARQVNPTLNMSLELGESVVSELAKQEEWSANIVNYAARLASPMAEMPSYSNWVEKAVSMLDRLPSEREIIELSAPIEVERTLITEWKKLHLEEVLIGRIVTPESWYRPEVEDVFRSVFLAIQHSVFSSGITCINSLLAQQKAETTAGVKAVYSLYLLWHRCLQHRRDDLESFLPEDRRRLLAEAFSGCRARAAQGNNDELESPLLHEVATCCLLMVLADKFESEIRTVDPILIRLLMPFSDVPDMLDGIHRMQAIAGLALLVSELRQRPGLCDDLLSRFVAILGDDAAKWEAFLSRWDMTLSPYLAFQFGLQESLIMKYHPYFYTVWQDIQQIPEVPVNDGGIGWRTELDHPSEFIKRHNMYGTVSPDDCVKEFTERLKQFQPPKTST